VSEPIETDDGAVIVKALEREDPSPDQLAEGRQELKMELLNQRKNQFYSAYMNKARERMRIDINRGVLAALLGS
jgi:parvulin-like peptidyl-prolyl isomerase